MIDIISKYKFDNEEKKLVACLLKKYNQKFVIEAIILYFERFKSVKSFKYDYSFICLRLYEMTKKELLPAWIQELKYKEKLLETHDLIIKECTFKQAEYLNDGIISKLNQNYIKKMPFFIQLNFFQCLDLDEKIDENIILKQNYSLKHVEIYIKDI
jgi:hypothetical protein